MPTENVAILFTDIVGSTALSQRLSAEIADKVRRGHFSILRQGITESGGIEVKNLGDGVMVAFSSASAALGCAVSMQQGTWLGSHPDPSRQTAWHRHHRPAVACHARTRLTGVRSVGAARQPPSDVSRHLH